MSTVVVIPGGFHPFHAGHKALYDSAVKAFPGASIYLAATNDTKTRPFPFSVKEKLAKVSGVPSGQLVQVKSPFQPREITSQFDPASDVLIFVRSEKDKNESPTLGGTKKDGSASYLQPYTKGQLQPFGKQAYMAYLPTVNFGPGLTSATEIRDAWPTLNEKRKAAMVMSLYPATQQNKRLVNVVVKLLDSALNGSESMNESQNLLQVPNNIANTVADLLNHKKPELFTRYGPEYVMNIIQDVCTEAPNKSITELAIETVHQLKKQINESTSVSDMNNDNNLSVEQLAQISDKALDDAYHYGRSTPGANFGWMANLQSAKAAKRLIDSGETDIEKISDAIHKGWNVTAAADYKGQLQLDTPTPEDKKLKRAKLAMQSYAQLPEEEKEKDRVVARALLSAIKGGELAENLGMPMPNTYEQEYNMYKTPGRQRRTTELTTEEADKIEKQVNVTESADYLEEK